MEVYLDNAATTQVRAEAVEKMLSAMQDGYGNPSSTHRAGRGAAKLLAAARESVASALGAATCEICFTSGGTEADNWAILSSAEAGQRGGRHMITSSAEHEAVLAPARKLESLGWEVDYLAPDSTGRVPADSLSDALRGDTALVSIMLVNNETGAVNPVEEYARIIKKRGSGAMLHTDAVQGLGKIPINVNALGADLVSVSAHKIHGPKGAGALYIKRGTKLPAMFAGGGQESGRRAGTEALPAIAGFGEAARLAHIELEEASRAVRYLREYAAGLLAAAIPRAIIIGEGDSPYILSFSLPGARSEVLMNYLDGEGVCVASGAACGKGARSHVLKAMKLKDSVIAGALRVSFSRYSTKTEAEYLVDKLRTAYETLRR
ncbi:MAG: cysteine desulfurase [Oscillospiraceae bacterium]|nr:cysteine desulfurase [Oscillospiraceae bacterium]